MSESTLSIDRIDKSNTAFGTKQQFTTSLRQRDGSSNDIYSPTGSIANTKKRMHFAMPDKNTWHTKNLNVASE